MLDKPEVSYLLGVLKCQDVGVVAAREILPDPKFSSQTIAKFMNHVMQDGKKSIAESIVYGALDRVQEKSKVDPVEFFETTLEKVRPMVEVKARRVGGATYQVPMEVRPIPSYCPSYALVSRCCC